MKDPKKILLIVVVLILTLSVAYLTYLLQDGSNPLLIFNTRASIDETLLVDEEINQVEEELNTMSDELQQDELAYNSTSPSPSVSTTGTPSGTPSVSPSISPDMTTTITPTMTPTSTPTPTKIPTPTPLASTTKVQELPVAGIADKTPLAIIGGGVLILLALLL